MYAERRSNNRDRDGGTEENEMKNIPRGMSIFTDTVGASGDVASEATAGFIYSVEFTYVNKEKMI